MAYDYKPKTLDAVSNLLLPGVWAMAGSLNSNKSWGLEVDAASDHINLVSDKGDRVRVVSRKEIEDESYRESFGQKLIDAMGSK